MPKADDVVSFKNYYKGLATPVFPLQYPSSE